MTQFMRDVLKRVKKKRERVHKMCKEILGDTGYVRMHVRKLVCSSKGKHF